jgi:hypothetical protein
MEGQRIGAHTHRIGAAELRSVRHRLSMRLDCAIAWAEVRSQQCNAAMRTLRGPRLGRSTWIAKIRKEKKPPFICVKIFLSMRLRRDPEGWW